MLQIEWYLIDFTLRNVSVRFDDYGPSTGHQISDALKFPGFSTPLICFKQNDILLISLSETLVSGSTIMAQVRDIKISDALKFPGIFAPLICFKQNDIWLISLSETLVSGSTIMAKVRDIKISDALTFPGIFTALICFK